MKILHVVPSFNVGGMEKVICSLVRNTRARYEHVILSLDGQKAARTWLGDESVSIPDFDGGDGRSRFFAHLYHELKAAAPDLLMTYNWGATDAIWLGRAAGIRRIIHSEHGVAAEEQSGTLWKRDVVRGLVYRLAEKVVAVSREFEVLLQRTYRLRPARIERIPNGIDTSYFCPDARDRCRIRKQLGLSNRHVVFGFAGRMDPIKNLPLLVEGFARCRRMHPEAQLLLVGDGPARARVEAACRENEIEPNTIFVGETENILPYLRAMDLFLLTSVREQMPMAVLEAMSVGIPVVATRVGDLPQMIDDGINGCLIDPAIQARAFSRALFDLLCSEQRRRMGEAARRKAVETFGQQPMVDRYRALIEFNPRR